MGRLDDADLTRHLSRREEAGRLAVVQRRLLGLRLQAAGLLGDARLGPALCVVLEGWDAAGKGSAIRRLVEPLDPRHVNVVQFAAPTPSEMQHHFLHRFAPALPGRGEMAVLDRSWYGRVLVERVDRLASETQWRRAYLSIAAFERELVLAGTVFVKLWLHISAAEQLRRFHKREADPIKRWKLSEADWHNREHREEYIAAVEDMFSHTDRPHAHWRVVPAESKRYARVRVIEHVIDALEHGLRGGGIEPVAVS
jgi:polyphosphate kinase 2 (PPK2 family)